MLERDVAEDDHRAHVEQTRTFLKRRRIVLSPEIQLRDVVSDSVVRGGVGGNGMGIGVGSSLSVGGVRASSENDTAIAVVVTGARDEKQHASGHSSSSNSSSTSSSSSSISSISISTSLNHSSNKIDSYNNKKKSSIAFVGYASEDHKQPIFGVAFNPNDHDALVFATAGGNRATVYHYDEARRRLEIVQVYIDENPEETWYTCAWSQDPVTGHDRLAIAGLTGVIKILNLRLQMQERVFSGHGKDVNELKFHPIDPNLMLSASKDFSLRLWNVKSSSCIAIFGGEEGHRDAVLSVDFHLSGTKFVSAGMDNAIKIWGLDSPKITDAIAQSYEDAAQEKRSGKSDSMKRVILDVQFPLFSSREIHRNYVDCVRWYGDAILSKSTECSIILWCPDPSSTPKRKEDGRVIYLQEFHFKDCEIWYVRFGLSPDLQHMIVGNQKGRLFMWDMKKSMVLPDESSRTPHARILTQFSHTKCKNAVRQVSVSPCSRFLVACCEDATIWLLEMK